MNTLLNLHLERHRTVFSGRQYRRRLPVKRKSHPALGCRLNYQFAGPFGVRRKIRKMGMGLTQVAPRSCGRMRLTPVIELDQRVCRIDWRHYGDCAIRWS